MAWKQWAMLLAAPALFAAVPASAERAPEARQASIPFVNMGSIHDWRADSDHGLYVQDLRRNWYYATLFGPCTDLPYADAIGFETRGTSSLDKYGAVIVRGQRCVFSSFVASAGPPVKAKKAHKG